MVQFDQHDTYDKGCKGMESTSKSEIRQKRERLGLSLRTAGSLADINFNHLSKVERGLASLSVSSMLRLAALLEVTPEWLAKRLGAIEQQRGQP